MRMANIYVGNLSFNTSEEELRNAFAAYGAVDTVSIVMDRMTGRSRGFGFVEMSDNSAAQAAIEALNGSEMAGRALTVNEARPKSEGGGGRRGGGGGGDRGGRERW
jgi:cold-inducible RNA-binding protein